MKRIVKILGVLFLVFSLSSVLFACDKTCEEDPTQEKCQVNETAWRADIDNNFNINTTWTDGMLLPSSYQDNTTITWKSMNDKVIEVKEDGGYLYEQAKDTKVSLEATFRSGNIEYVKVYEINIPKVETSIFDIAWDYYRNSLPAETIKNVRMITRAYGDYTIEYQTMNPEIFENDGTVHQNNSNQVATINIILTKGYMKKMFVKEVTVLKYTDSQLVSKVCEWVDSQVELYKKGEIDRLPNTHPELGTTIAWNANQMGIISSDGNIVKPVEYMNLMIKCEVKSNDRVVTNGYELVNFGGNTEEAFLDAWLISLIPTRIYGSINHLQQEGEWTTLDYQERTNVGGVLNLIEGVNPLVDNSYYIDLDDEAKVATMINNFYCGTHPEVSTDILNSRFTEGYQIPNPNNIMWIVCHESGMPLEGQDAELLANLQWKNAYVTVDARKASWNYQVDAYKIYQSFSDDIGCWHASDGSRPGTGNANGIGIEMCINQDGNYEGAMHNNAKLVASLMSKYNLKMENIKRHYDMAPDKKECPSYMIRTNRWEEFLRMVDIEHTAIKHLQDATVNWTVDRLDLFTKGDNNLYYNKAVKEKTPVNITLEVTKGDYHFKETGILYLYPNE